MKITGLETFMANAGFRNYLFVRLATDAGISGIGEATREAWSRLLPETDLLITNRSVTEHVFGRKGPDEELMRWYTDSFGCRLVCMTSREMLGLSWLTRQVAKFIEIVGEAKRTSHHVILSETKNPAVKL